MDIFRRIILIILTPFLPLLLLIAALDFGIVHTIGNAGQVKTIVSQSGLYDQVVPALLKQVKQIDTSVGSIPLSDPTVQQAAEKTFTPGLVKQNAESVIDNIYDWLNGKIGQPNFKIDLSSAQSSFADNLAVAVNDRAAALPACTTPYTATSFDAYNATCLPRGVSAAQVAGQLKTDVKNGKGFVQSLNLSATDVKNQSNQSVFEGQLKDAPKQYQKVKKTPALLIALVVLTASAIVFLSSSRRRGLRHVGLTFLVVGLLMLVLAWSLNRANASVIQPKITLNNAVLQTDIKKLVTEIVQKIDKNYWSFGLIYVLIGAACVMGPGFFGRRPLPAGAEADVAPNPEAKPPETRPAPAKKKVTKINVL